jgi:hypothetical protein
MNQPRVTVALGAQRLSRNALSTTLTELRAMAAPATIGFK